MAPSAAGPLVVAGIGVNVAMTRADLPVPTATALTLAGFPRPGGGDVVVAIARAFTGWHHRWYDGSVADLRAAYRSRCDTLGREIDLHLPDGSILRGDAVDIADGGELVLQYRPEEHREPVRRAFGAGDVIHVRRADPGVGGTGGMSDRTGAPHRTDRSGMIGP